MGGFIAALIRISDTQADFPLLNAVENKRYVSNHKAFGIIFSKIRVEKAT